MNRSWTSTNGRLLPGLAPSQLEAAGVAGASEVFKMIVFDSPLQAWTVAAHAWEMSTAEGASPEVGDALAAAAVVNDLAFA